MSRWRRRIVVTGILVLAAVVRLWGLADYPPGLYPDQAANGVDALEILDGDLQVYSPRNNGRESLFFYVQALTLGLFGIGVWPMFAASALVGIATVVVIYLAGARLFGTGPGLLAAFFLATNPWHVTLSRTGFRAVMVPLLIALSLWAIVRTAQATGNLPRFANAILAGVLTALGFYTYPAYRAFLLFLTLGATFVLLRLMVQPSLRAWARRLVLPVIVGMLAALLTSLPLIAFFLAHPEFVASRASHVSIFNPDLNRGHPAQTFFRMFGRTLGAFLWDGDGNPRHNVPFPGLPYTPGGQHHPEGGGAPFLLPVPALLALLGIGIALRRAPWLLVLFLVMLLPAVVTAESIPHGLRTAGAIPAAVFLAGLGGAGVWQRLRAHPWQPVRLTGILLTLLLLLATAGTDLVLYFVVARNTPLAHYEYRGDLTVVSAYLNGRAVGRRSPYLVLDRFSAMTVHFLTTETRHPYRRLDPEASGQVALQPGEEMVFTQSTLADAARYQFFHQGVVIRDVRENRFGEIVMVVLAPPSLRVPSQ